MERKITKKKRALSIDRNLNTLMEEIIFNKSAYIEYLIYQDLLKNSNDERIKKNKYLIMARKLTTDEFIEKARKVHGDKYNYSLVEYINTCTIIKVICKKHGVFEQTPNSHLSGYGCKKCGNLTIGNKLRITTDEFIEKAKKVHGDKYDYSMVKYNGTKTKVKIICPTHGIFEQIPNSHLSGKGCKECANDNLCKTKNFFINKAKLIHSDKYDYSLVNYIKSSIKVKIKCKEHGIFEQRPHDHIINKNGCPKCANYNKYNIKTTEEFIEKARNLHGDKYDYSLVKYINSQTKVKIICPIHGVFEQRPNKHLNGRGCPNCCNNKKLSIEKFIKKAKEIHGDKYDYSLVKYKNNITKVKIICPIHGEFEQRPKNHLRGWSTVHKNIEKLGNN